LHSLQRIAYAQEAALLQAKHFPPLLRTLNELIASDEAFLGAFAGDALVGALSTERDARGETTIASLVVHPAHQRRGIARALLLAALQSSHATPTHVATGARNAPVLALYASASFVETKRWVVGEEALELVALVRAPGPL
jgi:ribosomal protein S18 acetylase RimI-like enzyme